MSALWNNPFTTTVGAAGAIVGILHALGVNLPVDASTVNTVLVVLLGLLSKDAAAPAK
jgi:hypothetical protein